MNSGQHTLLKRDSASQDLLASLAQSVLLAPARCVCVWGGSSVCSHVPGQSNQFVSFDSLPCSYYFYSADSPVWLADLPPAFRMLSAPNDSAALTRPILLNVPATYLIAV